MEEVKTTGEYVIYKKKNGRYAIKAKDGTWLNGKKKSEILFAEKLITIPPPKEEAPVVEAPVPEEEVAAAAPAEKEEQAEDKEAS